MEQGDVVSESRFRVTGRRMTQQRKLVLRVLGEAAGHLDAREIYDRARVLDPHLSLATVYRTLGALKAAGVVRELHLDQDHHHYELDAHDDHSHLVCLGCGQVVEVDSRAVAEAARAAGETRGFSVASAQVELTGYCADCRRNKPGRSATRLSGVPVGACVRLRTVEGGRDVLGRLASLGFTPGTELCVVQNSGHGPLLVTLRDTRVALGRGEASKILVEGAERVENGG